MDAAVVRLHCQRKRRSFTLKSKAKAVVAASVTMWDPARALMDAENDLIPKRMGSVIS